MTSEHEFQKEGELLVEHSKGDKLINGQNQEVAGTWERKTRYEVESAIDLVGDLQRQLKEIDDKRKPVEKQLAQAREKLKLPGVDRAFWQRFLKCAEAWSARKQVDRLEEALKSNDHMKKELTETLDKIRAVYPELFAQKIVRMEDKRVEETVASEPAEEAPADDVKDAEAPTE